MKTRVQSEIQSAAIARGTDRVTHETFYVVRSDSDPNVWYEVRWNDQALMWQDKCPAHCADCKHVRAVQEVLKIRRATIALATKPVQPVQPRREYAALNGTREFNLMR